MGATVKRTVANAIIAGFLVIIVAHLGVPKMLGAHPFWAVKIGYIGVVVGIIIYAVAWIWETSWVAKFIAFVGLLIVSGGLTYFGKTRFAASFAEDVLAGRFWYFGWIAVAAFFFALLVHILSTRPGA